MSNSNDSNPEINKDLIQSYFSKTDKRNNKAGITPKTFYLPNRPGFVDNIRDNLFSPLVLALIFSITFPLFYQS